MAFTTPADRPGASFSSVVFRDGLGERRHLHDPSRGNIELLCIRQELNEVSSFEFALRERVNRLAAFRHAYFSPVRGVERISGPDDTLAIVSDVTPGIRLSELLASLEERHVTLDITAALKLIRQIVPAVAMLHESARDVAHGAIAPERLIVTPNARLVVVDYVLGSALEQLRYSHERYWTDLRVAIPKTGGPPRFDHRADVLQIGLVALSLILGRMLRREEYPNRVRELLASAWSTAGSDGGSEPLPPGLNAWLGRVLQLDTLTAFPSAVEARAELDKVLGDGGAGTSPGVLQSVLSRYPPTDRPRVPSPTTGAAHSGGVAVLDVPAPSRGSTAPNRAVAPVRDVSPATPPRPEGAPKTTLLSALDAGMLPDPVVVKQPTLIPDLPPMKADRSSMVLPSLALEAEPKSPKLSVLDLKTLADPVGRASAVDLTQVSVTGPSSAQDSRPLTLPSLAAPDPPKTPKLAALDRKPLADPTPAVTYSLRSFESTDDEPGGDKPKRFPLWKWVGGAAIVLPALVGGGALTAKRMGAKPAIPQVGTLVITTNPAGVQTLVDGDARGTTPLTVELPVGPHTVELVGGGAPKTVPVTITAGMQTAQYIDLATETGAADSPHEAPTGAAEAVKQVSPAGAAAAALTPPAAAAVEPPPAPTGWLSVSGPLIVQVFEKGKSIGSGRDRITLPSGKHDVELVNDDLGYRVSRSIDVQPGKGVTVQQEVPKAAVALNALPWAEVWINGEKVGETPIGNLSLPIGTHELVFRHPDLGERRQSLVVSLKNPARVSVDLRQR
jgi:serine/threonine protein kinase